MKLAIEGGTPVRAATLPYGKPWVDDDDIAAVAEVLRSDFLTTGPRVASFEQDVARVAGAEHAVAVSNGTAALHAAYFALGVGPGDEVIVPAITFAATANAAVYLGATPIFCDVDSAALLADAKSIEAKITSRTKAIAVVDYAGQPCDYRVILDLAARHRLPVIADACHALGAVDEIGRKAGSIATVSTFSFHPVKSITTGEGGAITTNDAALAAKMRVFRNHGITSDFRQREAAASYAYEMVDLGFNYRLTDVSCALGSSQLKKLDAWTERRNGVAAAYDAAFAGSAFVEPLIVRSGVRSAYHLYVVQLALDKLRVDRDQVFRALRAEGIGVNVHYIPVHLHPFYRARFGTAPGLCPVAEAAFTRIVTLPLFPKMSDADVGDVIAAVNKVTESYAR